MKKIFAILVCLALALSLGFAGAEAAGKEDYTVVSVNGAFSIRGITPDGYQVTDIDQADTGLRRHPCHVRRDQ